MQTFFSVQTSLKEALQVIWDSLPQGPINKAVKSSTPQLKTCTKADREHKVAVKHQTKCSPSCFSDRFTVFRRKRFSACENC